MSERELFELTEEFKERCEGLIFNNGKYEFDRNIEGLSQIKMAILGLNLTVVNSAWYGWQASANREGYKLVPVEPSDHMKCVVRGFDPDIEDYANMSSGDWESLCSDIYKAMIGACDDH